MAVPGGTATTFDLPNFVGPIFQTSITQTPFSSMLGGLALEGNAGAYVTVDSPQFTWQDDDLPAASQDVQVEGDDPTASHRSRDDVLNVAQIHQEAVQIAYSKLAGTGLITTDNANLRSNTANLGPQPVQNEVDHQLDRKFKKIKRDYEFSALQGTFQNPASNASARQTRGLLNHISTNAVAAGSVDLSRDHYQEVLRTMADNGAIFENLVAFMGSFNRQLTTDIYAYAPESRTVGGVRIEQIMTDFGDMGVSFAAVGAPAAQVCLAEMSVQSIVAFPTPGKGVLFAEPLARTGASVKVQIYGELGIASGPETYSGKITGTTTS